MITFLSSPKAFTGKIGENQVYAMQSWLSVNPDVEVILYGKSKNASEVCGKLGVTYVPDISATPSGIPYFNAITKHANMSAKNEVQIYLNCDILVNESIIKAISLIPFEKYLIVGQRIDLADGININIQQEKWLKNLQKLTVNGKATLHAPTGEDYFIFKRGMWKKLPPLVIGRAGYDNALIAYCLRRRIPVVDATSIISAIHLYHGYKYLKVTNKRETQDQLAEKNLELHDIVHSPPTVTDADWKIIGQKIKRNYSRGDLVRYSEIKIRYHHNYKMFSYLIRILWRILAKCNICDIKQIDIKDTIDEYMIVDKTPLRKFIGKKYLC